jgi:hypothetical protein
VSFRDEVQLDDLARGFEAAFQREILPKLGEDERFACITHSTGGPVIRYWWQRLYGDQNQPLPMSHLVMLAPANFGSALAQLGKGRLGRLRSGWNCIEPGQGVLNWLEHASPESWELNRDWIQRSAATDPGRMVPSLFQFVLTGQTIDRKMYDHVNSYTGESGSDGTVRVAAANLNASYLRLEQTIDADEVERLMRAIDQRSSSLDLDAWNWNTNLHVVERVIAAPTAFRLIPEASHVGEKTGILFSIESSGASETVSAIVRCLNVKSRHAYDRLCDDFTRENETVRRSERVEVESGFFRNTYFFHDTHSLVMVRLRDDRGQPITDFDFKLTGRRDSPDGLPPGFFVDRQCNRRDPSALTYYINTDAMTGMPAVKDPRTGKVIRGKFPGVDRLGIRVYPRPLTGYAHYFPGILAAAVGDIDDFVRADETTMLDIILRRIVHRGVHEVVPADDIDQRGDFRNQPRGEMLEGN